MGIPNTAEPLPAPPPNESNGAVTFGGGGHQTWKLESPIADGVYPGKVKAWKRILSTYKEKTSERFVFLCSVDGREGDGELAHYTGTRLTGHPKEKLGPFLRDVLKLPLPTPQNPSLPDPIGRPLKLFVKNEPGTNDSTKMYPKVKEVMPA